MAHSVDQSDDGGFLFRAYRLHPMEMYLLQTEAETIGSSKSMVQEICSGKILGGNGTDVCYAISQTPDGGSIVAGISTSLDGIISGNHGEEDYWIIKLDASGNVSWQQMLVEARQMIRKASSSTSDGGYILSGYSYSNDGDLSRNQGSSDFWVVKLEEVSTRRKCLF